MTLRAKLSGAVWASVAALLLPACSGTGDFGRARQDVWTQVLLPQVGFWSATARGEAVSSFQMTDDEQQLRDRAWRLVMPAHERNVFSRLVSDLAHQRVLPVEAQSNDVADYHAGLTGGAYISQVSRYVRLAQDAGADRLLLTPLRFNAARVVAADRVRLRAAEAAPLVAPDKRDPAFARVVENEGVILWVCERLRFRVESYRYAVSNLVVETPSREAVASELAVMALAAEVEPLCAIPLIGVFGRGGGGSPPLPLPPPPDLPIVSKG